MRSAPTRNWSRFEIDARAATLRRHVDDLARQVQAPQPRSLVDGRTGQIQVADRAAVPRAAPLLSVVDLSRLEVEPDVPESLARDLAPGTAAELSGNGGRWSGKARQPHRPGWLCLPRSRRHGYPNDRAADLNLPNRRARQAAPWRVSVTGIFSHSLTVTRGDELGQLMQGHNELGS